MIFFRVTFGQDGGPLRRWNRLHRWITGLNTHSGSHLSFAGFEMVVEGTIGVLRDRSSPFGLSVSVIRWVLLASTQLPAVKTSSKDSEAQENMNDSFLMYVNV